MQSKMMLRVFIAAPDDLKDERTALEDIISELNITWSNYFDVHLDLIKWETHCYPSMGADPQSVINEQIGDNYEIFIGMLWKKFGTPTPRAGSGTIEEFNRAYKRFNENPDSVIIMLYFNNSPVPINELEPDQLSSIKEFRNKLGTQGIHWTYNNIEDFKMLLRKHLTWAAQKWYKKSCNEKEQQLNNGIILASHSETNVHANTAIVSNEDGFLDLIEVGQDSFESLNEVVTRMKDAIEAIGSKMEERGAELESAKKPNEIINIKIAKRIIDHAADDMEQFNARMDTEVPLFKMSYTKGIDAYGRAATLSIDFNSENENELITALEGSKQLSINLKHTKDKIISFKEVIRALPRISTKFNRAKRQTVDILNQFISEMKNAESMTLEAANIIENAITEYRSRRTNQDPCLGQTI